MVICGVNKTHTQKVIVANRLNLFASKLLMRGNTWSFFNTNIFPVTKTKQNKNKTFFSTVQKKQEKTNRYSKYKSNIKQKIIKYI